MSPTCRERRECGKEGGKIPNRISEEIKGCKKSRKAAKISRPTSKGRRGKQNWESKPRTSRGGSWDSRTKKGHPKTGGSSGFYWWEGKLRRIWASGWRGGRGDYWGLTETKISSEGERGWGSTAGNHWGKRGVILKG